MKQNFDLNPLPEDAPSQRGVGAGGTSGFLRGEVIIHGGEYEENSKLFGIANGVGGCECQVVYMDDGEYRWNVMVTKSDTDMFYWSGISAYDGANMIILRDNPKKLITLYLYILQSSPLAESSVTDLQLLVDGVEVPLVRESVLLDGKNKNNMYSHISSYIISENIVQHLANGESVEILAIVYNKEVRHSLQKSAINGLKSFL